MLFTCYLYVIYALDIYVMHICIFLLFRYVIYMYIYIYMFYVYVYVVDICICICMGCMHIYIYHSSIYIESTYI